MATSPEPPAMDRVLATTELLESILLEIADNETLLGAQRVSTTFRNCIKTSPGLRQRLFFRAVEEGTATPTIIDFLDEEYDYCMQSYKHNPLTLSYNWSHHGYHLLPHIKLPGLETFAWAPSDETLTVVLEDPVQLAQALATNKSSFLDMHMIQPLYPIMTIEVLNRHPFVGSHFELYCGSMKVIANDSGTLRQVLGLAMSLRKAGDQHASILRDKRNKDIITKRCMEVLEPEPWFVWRKFLKEQKGMLYGKPKVQISSRCYNKIV